MANGFALASSLQERGCVECPADTPACPATCEAGFRCSIVIQTCDKCQYTTCVADPTIASSTPVASPSNGGGGPNVGGIAGGVIGGVAAIAILVYLVWRFCIKSKRQQFESDDWVEFQDEPTAAEKEFTMRRDARASTHTVHSIASTVLTRASNIIQIAYIPGVTNRSNPSTPGLLVPPVPPIPIALSSPNTPYEDDHFFMPGDLRDSTYSGMSDRTSYAPRSSVASTIYGRNAVISPVAAQTFRLGKAAVVSVKSNPATSPGVEQEPPVPNVDYGRYKTGPPSPAFSVGSTFLNSASAATSTPVRPNVVRMVNNPGRKDSVDSDADDQNRDLTRESAAITIIDDTPSVEQGPFSDPPPRAAGHTKRASVSALIEEATSRAHGDVRAGLALKRTPFGDEHATEDS